MVIIEQNSVGSSENRFKDLLLKGTLHSHNKLTWMKTSVVTCYVVVEAFESDLWIKTCQETAKNKRYTEAVFGICQLNWMCWWCDVSISVLNLKILDHIPTLWKKKCVKYANSFVGHAEILSKYNKKYGPIYRGWAGSQGTVTVSTPEAAEVKNLYIEASTFSCEDTNGRKTLLLVAN